MEGLPKEEGLESIGNKELFIASTKSRLDKLVEEGRMPKAFADSRLKAAKRIEIGFKNPETDSLNFAEIGLEQIETFTNKVTEIETYTGEKIKNPFEKADLIEEVDIKFEKFGEDLSSVLDRLRETLK